MTIFIIAIINLFSMTIIFNQLQFKSQIRSYNNFPKEMNSYKPKFQFWKQFEIRYLRQTQLDRYFTIDEFGQIYLIWCAVIIVLLLTIKTNTIIFIVTLLLVICAPFVILEKYLSLIDLKIDQGIFELLTQINARLIKNEDVISALKESQCSLKNKRIVYIINQFNQHIKLGIPPVQVFSMIQTSIHNDYMKYLFVNIEIVFKRRGNITELMKALENEFTSIQIEVNKRKVEIEYEKNMMLLSIALVAMTVAKITNDHDYILEYFSQNDQMVTFVVIFIILGLVIALSANKTSY